MQRCRSLAAASLAFAAVMSRRLGDSPALIVGVSVFAGGVVTYIFWLTRSLWSEQDLDGLKGLFDYPSAYLGDVLLLPVAAAGLAALCHRLGVSPLNGPALAAGAAGLLVGTLTQILWLLDPHPGLNWTLTSPHHFNIAGIWHTFYLILASATFGSLGLASLLAVRKARRDGRHGLLRTLLDSPEAMIALTGLLGFVVLLARDSIPRGLANWSSVVAVLVAMVCVISLSRWALASEWHALRWPLSWAVWNAAVIVLCVELLPHAFDAVDRGFQLGLAASALSTVAISVLATYRDQPKALNLATARHLAAISAALTPACALAWALLALFVQTKPYLFAVAIWMVVLGPIVLDLLAWLRMPQADIKNDAPVVISVWSIGAITLLASARDWTHVARGPSSEIAVVVIVAVLSGVLFRPIRRRIGGLLRKVPEPGQSEATNSAAQLPSIRNLDFDKAFLIIAAGAAFLALCSLAHSTLAARQPIHAGAEPPDPTATSLIAVGVVAVGALGARLKLPAAALILVVWPCGLFWTGMVTIPKGLTSHLDGTTAIIIALIVLASVIYGVWTLNSIVSNVVLLRGSELPGTYVLIVAGCVASSIVTGYAASTGALGPSLDRPYPFWWGIISALLVLLVNCAVVGTAAIAAAPVTHRAEDFGHPLGKGVFQDGPLFSFLFLIAAVFPTQSAMFSTESDFWARLTTSFTVASPMLTFFVLAFLASMTLNADHAMNELRRLTQGDAGALSRATKCVEDNEHHGKRIRSYWGYLRKPSVERGSNVDQAVLVHAHCANQNLLAYVFTAATLFGALVLVGERE